MTALFSDICVRDLYLCSAIYSRKRPTRPILWIMPIYLRASPADLRFVSWYLPGTNHFRVTISVMMKWTTQPCWAIKLVLHNHVRRIRSCNIWSSAQDFSHLYWTTSKIRSWNVATREWAYFIGWVGRISALLAAIFKRSSWIHEDEFTKMCSAIYSRKRPIYVHCYTFTKKACTRAVLFIDQRGLFVYTAVHSQKKPVYAQCYIFLENAYRCTLLYIHERGLYMCCAIFSRKRSIYILHAVYMQYYVFTKEACMSTWQYIHSNHYHERGLYIRSTVHSYL